VRGPFVLVHACSCLSVLVSVSCLARHLYMLNSRAIYEVLNPMHEFTIRRRSSGKVFMSSLSCTLLRIPRTYSVLRSTSKSILILDVRYEFKTSEKEYTVVRHEGTRLDRTVYAVNGAVI
jgi:hypothetical protein